MKNTYIGIDRGTSSVKLLLVDLDGQILAEESESYEVIYPQSGWTEQNPNDWWQGTKKALERLLKGQNKEYIRALSFGGQMHGLVALDENNNVIRNCLLWNDGRSEAEANCINDAIGKAKLTNLTGNIAFAGFTATKILWVKNHEPESFARIRHILLPKDYLTYKFTGKLATDLSDAGGTLLLDVKNRCWQREMLDFIGVKEDWLPKLYESYKVVGEILPEIAREFGLNPDVKIIAGAGDNAAAAVGTGAVNNGDCNISLGTSGTIFLSSDSFVYDENCALHGFCHSNGKWHFLGCILTAASARKWWLEDILGNGDYARDELDIANADTENLIFLPYLQGERSPHNDVNAKGAFIGLTATTTKAQMSRAIMEGVAFAIRDCLEVIKANGVTPKIANLCGGGAKSHSWRQIMADVLDLPINILTTEQGPAFGAAILAMVGSGEYSTVEAATGKMVTVSETILPISANAESYDKKYKKFKKAYPLLRELF